MLYSWALSFFFINHYERSTLVYRYIQGLVGENYKLTSIKLKSIFNPNCISNFQIRNINSVRKSMSEKVTASIIHSYMYILSCLDYGNALLINANSDQIIKLQRVQNAAARILSKNFQIHTHNACSKKNFIGCPLWRGLNSRFCC